MLTYEGREIDRGSVREVRLLTIRMLRLLDGHRAAEAMSALTHVVARVLTDSSDDHAEIIEMADHLRRAVIDNVRLMRAS